MLIAIRIVVVLCILRFTYVGDHTGVRYFILKAMKKEEELQSYEAYPSQGIFIELCKNVSCLLVISHFIFPYEDEDYRLYILAGIAIFAFMLGILIPKKFICYPHDGITVTPGGCIFVAAGGIAILKSCSLMGKYRFWIYSAVVFGVLILLFSLANYKQIKGKGVLDSLAFELVVLALGLTAIISFNIGVHKVDSYKAKVINSSISATGIYSIDVSNGKEKYHFVISRSEWMLLPPSREVTICKYSSWLGFTWGRMEKN